MRIKGDYILSRRSIARMIATITAALMLLCTTATAKAEATIRRIHDTAIALHTLDLQMVGRLTRTAVPDFMYLEYKALYLELKPSVDAAKCVPPASATPPHITAAPRQHHSRRGSGLKGKRTERMVEQLAEFTTWLRDNPINERNPARTVGARASLFWRLHEKTFNRDALRVGEKRGFGSGKTLASAFRNSKA